MAACLSLVRVMDRLDDLIGFDVGFVVVHGELGRDLIRPLRRDQQDRSLPRREARQDQVEKNERIRSKPMLRLPIIHPARKSSAPMTKPHEPIQARSRSAAFSPLVS